LDGRPAVEAEDLAEFPTLEGHGGGVFLSCKKRRREEMVCELVREKLRGWW
jgi:hypothetical protein